MPRVISVVSGKGGVGKTTCVLNLGALLANRYGKKVVLIDCNITSSHLGLQLGLYDTPFTLNKVLKKKTKLDQALYSYSPNLDILPASLNLRDLEKVDIKKLSKFLEKSFEDYDYVLLDSAAGFGKEATSAIMASDEVLFISTPDIPSLTDIIKGKDLADNLDVQPIGLVLNRVRNKKFELNQKEITKLTGLSILEAIPEDERVLESLGNKRPVVDYRPRAKASQSYHMLASSLAGKTPERRRENIFSRFVNIFRR